MIGLLTKLSRPFCVKVKQGRTLIVPQQFTVVPLQQYFHISSKNYDFLLKTNPTSSQIYAHTSDTPSNLLKKPAIHIFPDSVTQQSAEQKFKAFTRKLQNDYQKAYASCKTPGQVFHLQRRIKTDIMNRCKFIGRVTGKYKHYNLFKSFNQIRGEKTLQQYMKNGITVPLLGKSNKIYPKGPVWLPTSDTYLKLLQKYLNQNNNSKPQNILDLGCGSGILSFILAKQYKNAKVYAVDSNKFAIQTCQVNAASFQLKNIQAFQANITKLEDFQFILKQKKCPDQFDLIISNPPWLIAKKSQNESQILDGVYDNKGKFLDSTFKLAGTICKYIGKLLKDNNSRYILIYSDLSSNLGIQPKSIQNLCKQNNLIIRNKIQQQYPNPINKNSAISKYKLMSKIQLYQLSKS